MVARPDLTSWQGCAAPSGESLTGRSCQLARLDVVRDVEPLFRAFAAANGGLDWTFLPYGPFETANTFGAWLSKASSPTDPLFYTIAADDISADGPVGLIALMRIDAPNGVLEIGHVLLSPLLQRTCAATEVIYLLLAHVFDELGYRRVEWKCDAAHVGSRRAAERFGFSYEGTFRQHRIVKGRNRDTAWFAMLDRDWPATKAEFQRWLDPGNFDTAGRQLTSLRPTSR
ncbi:MAG: GNAT family N-acetyltransferase [Hyphomicrobiaceae bacterium]|nr:GNAT family N-acetyltransferase [Hyphomicrobiaceae bacterium]